MSALEKFGKYTILKRIAVGGMAEISLARYDGIGGFEKLLALKRLLPTFCEDEALVAQFLNEARIAAALAHPNIVQTYEVGQFNDRYFIAMEYVPGTDLERLLRRVRSMSERVPLEIALRTVSQAGGGMHYAHGRTDAAGRPLHILHRDISPSNILCSFDGAVKLSDFGVAKVLRPGENRRSGVLRGKFAYMSPEQARGEDLDRRSDIFSLGILLYETTVGDRLFTGGNQFEILRRISEGSYQRPREVDPDFPEELEAIVMRALASNRDDRYPTALEMQCDIEQFGAWRGYRASSAHLAEYIRRIFADEVPPSTGRTGAVPRPSTASGAQRPGSSPGGSSSGGPRIAASGSAPGVARPASAPVPQARVTPAGATQPPAGFSSRPPTPSGAPPSHRGARCSPGTGIAEAISVPASAPMPPAPPPSPSSAGVGGGWTAAPTGPLGVTVSSPTDTSGTPSSVSEIPLGEIDPVKRYRDALSFFHHRRYRRCIDAACDVLRAEPQHGMARKCRDRAVVRALRESRLPDFQQQLWMAADLFEKSRIGESRRLLDDVIGDMPVSAPGRRLLQRVYQIVLDLSRGAGSSPGPTRSAELRRS